MEGREFRREASHAEPSTESTRTMSRTFFTQTLRKARRGRARPSVRTDDRDSAPEQAERDRVQEIADLLRRLARERARVGSLEHDAEFEAGHGDVPVERVQIS